MNLLEKYLGIIADGVIDPKSDAKMSKDLRKAEKSLTAFINKNYQKIMSMCNDKDKLKDFMEKGFDGMSISDKTKYKLLQSIDRINNKNQMQGYLTIEHILFVQLLLNFSQEFQQAPHL